MVVVPAALERPDLLVRPVGDHGLRARVASEEGVAHVCSVVGAVPLVVSVERLVHEIDEGMVFVRLEEHIPFAAPDDFDDVPAGSLEEGFELLDDLAVAADRAVQALQVAVDDEGQVVEALGGGQLQKPARLGLVHFPVAQEAPDPLAVGALDAPAVQVSVEPRLVDRGCRADPQRHGGELPEVPQLAGVGVGGQAAAARAARNLLAEGVEVRLAQAALEEGARVVPRRGVALEEDLVAPAGMVLAAEEMVESDLVEGGLGREGRDVAADGQARALLAGDHDGGVPADPASELALQGFVPRVEGLVLDGDRVDVGRDEVAGHAHAPVARPLLQSHEDVARPLGSSRRDEVVDRFDPLTGLLGVDIGHLVKLAVDKRRHPCL